MGERLYTFRHDQGYFEAGLARDKQVLLGNTVHEIVAHWFDLEGRFLGLERFPMAVDPPMFPGTTIYCTGTEYNRAVDAEMGALKEQSGSGRPTSGCTPSSPGKPPSPTCRASTSSSWIRRSPSTRRSGSTFRSTSPSGGRRDGSC